METLFSILMGLGLSAACGFRVFVPLLVAGIGIHAGALHPAPDFAWLGSMPALVGLGTATVLEIAAFYIPWLDNALDAAATPAAVIAGTVVAGSFIVDMNPWARWSLSLIAGGGIAAAVQTGTMGLRGLSLATTAGLANPIVSTLEWIAAALTSVLAILAPVLLLVVGLLAVGILAFVWRRLRTRLGRQPG
ncbi:MAG: DUF4126 domain-containing protein [Verrucomicrobia bacterium]|nr:DUF4126 domain-containing protein [Verrucomicrobiota bacterium]